MKVRTTLELSDALDNDYTWRLREVGYVKSRVDKCGGAAQQALIRAGTALLYAHWEGFVKRAASIYLEFVSRQNLTHRELKPAFVSASIARQNGRAGLVQGRSPDQALALHTGSVIASLDSVAVVPFKDRINTRSNLNYGVFVEVAEAIELDLAPFVLREKKIDELVARRNSIAHGEYLEIARDYFSEMCDLLLETMERLKTELVNAAATKAYKA